MSRLIVRIRIVRMHGGKYRIDKVKVSEDHGDRVDVFIVPIKEVREFTTKNEAREYGAQLAHAFVTSKYDEGARYELHWKTRVEIPQEVAEKALGH